MTRTRLLGVALVGMIAVGGAGAYLLYDNILRGDDVAALVLPSAAPSTSPPTSTSGATATAPAREATTDPASDPGIAGTWTVVEGSAAGYRVRERLASLPAESDAVGRTGDISGSITLVAADPGAQLTAATLTVDTTTIASNEGRRDNRMRTDGLQTDRFPTASFTLTAPLDIPASAVDGTATDVTLAGDLTLHGVTKPVEIPAHAQLADGQLQVAGSLTFALADFDIVAPNVGGFIVSIADEGTLEFLVVLAKA